MKYILALLLLVTGCDLRCLEGCPEEIPDTPTVSDVASGDVRNYHEDILNTLGPEEDDVLWIKDQEVLVSTDFPAPSWFR